MKVKIILALILSFLFVSTEVCLALRETPVCRELTKTFKEDSVRAYWMGYNKLSCREVRIDLAVRVIKAFMEDPNLPACVIESIANALENACEIGMRDGKSGENSLEELSNLEVIIRRTRDDSP